MSNEHSLQTMMNRLKAYYGGMKVAVAGGAGFVGIQLVNLLSDLVGEDGMVMVLDDFSHGFNVVDKPNVYYAFKSPENHYFPYELRCCRDARMLVSTRFSGLNVSSNNYSYLLEDVCVFFNLAATVAGVLYNESHHLQMYANNIAVLLGPIIACEKAGVRTFFQTSSVCVYAEDHQSPCDESAGWGGDPHPANAGYAEAKRDGERAALWSNIQHIVIGRPSNIIGPYDYYGVRAHVVPAFVERATTTDGTFRAFGSATTMREFIYSWDVATGMAVAAAFGEDRAVYNIGANGYNVITMLSLAKKIIDRVSPVLGKDSERDIVFDNSRGGGDLERYSNSLKLRGLGWSHSVPLNNALDYIVDEYLYRGAWKDPNYLEEFNYNYKKPEGIPF